MSDWQALRTEAESLYERGNLTHALAAYERLVSLQPHDADLLNDLGVVRFALGQIQHSRDCFVQALRFDERNQSARDNLEMVRRTGCATLPAPPRCDGQGKPDAPLVAGPEAPGPFICPCCGGRFGRFLPAGGAVKRPNRKCPGCGSLERHRAVWLYVKSRTNLLSADLRLLHFAPMPALHSILGSMPNLHYITADLNSPRAALKMDITDILFRDDVFDAVLCIHVLEHVEDDRRAMREVFRVLKPGGWAILHSPVDPARDRTLEEPGIVTAEERERLYGQKDHVRAYGCDYKDRLEEAGFRVTLDDYVRTLGPEVIARHRLGRELGLYFCVKPHAGR